MDDVVRNNLLDLVPIFAAGFVSGWFMREAFEAADKIRHKFQNHDRRRGG